MACECPCGYLGLECEYFYNQSLIDEADYSKYYVENKDQKAECYLGYDSTYSCV